MKQTVCKRTAATYLFKNKVRSPVLLADAKERKRRRRGHTKASEVTIATTVTHEI